MNPFQFNVYNDYKYNNDDEWDCAHRKIRKKFSKMELALRSIIVGKSIKVKKISLMIGAKDNGMGLYQGIAVIRCLNGININEVDIDVAYKMVMDALEEYIPRVVKEYGASAELLNTLPSKNNYYFGDIVGMVKVKGIEIKYIITDEKAFAWFANNENSKKEYLLHAYVTIKEIAEDYISVNGFCLTKK